MQPTELVVETRAQLRPILDHSHTVLNLWKWITSASSKGVGSHQLVIALKFSV